MTNKKDAENAEKFYCEVCDFKCCKYSNWTSHLNTRKHKILINPNAKNAEQKVIMCECGKTYKHMSSLCAHKKKCKIKDIENNNEIINLTNLVLEVVKSNNEMQKQMIEMTKNNQNNTTTNHINSHNKTFNLQVFLNDTCNDAMNIMDFVDSIKLQLTDLENVGKNGFVAGISNIIMKNLKALDVTRRPVHCSDQKREIMYVKDENQWFNDSKEEPNNKKLTNAIKQIAHKNICMIPEWKAKYPDCIYSDSKKSDQYNHIIYEYMYYTELNSEKIIKKIAKEVIIEKL